MRKEAHIAPPLLGELAMCDFNFFKLFDTKELFIYY